MTDEFPYLANERPGLASIIHGLSFSPDLVAEAARPDRRILLAGLKEIYGSA